MDPDRLAAWMDAQGLGDAPIEAARPLSGGAPNGLLRFRRAGRDYAVRRPYPVEGFSAVAGLPEPHRSNPAIRRRIGFALVERIAALHNIDHKAAGLEDFGKPEGCLARQADRWLAQLEDDARHAQWPVHADLSQVDRIADRPRANLPPEQPPGILHGDDQSANVMYRPASGDLAALVDWELATIGDPRVDLGWVVAGFPGPGGPELPVLRPPGTASPRPRRRSRATPRSRRAIRAI